MEDDRILHPSHQSITVYPDNKHFASATERVDASVGTLRSNDADGSEKVKKNWFNKQNNNFAHSSHFFRTFLFAVFARLRRENALFRVLWRT